MITAVFTDNSDYARATGLWQWDYGQRLRIEGLKLPTAAEIHFALAEFAGDAITRVGTTKDGVTEVVIPDSLLENQAAGATYEIYAWIYLADNTSGETIKRISMQVKCRPKPEGFDAPEDAELFRDAIEAVNASADRAEAAREGAEAAHRAAEEAAGKIEGEITGAGQIAEQVKQDAEAVAKDKQAVSQMVTETTQNAQNAAEAAQAAERSSTAAKEAQTAAESAESGAAAAMEEVERDRTEVSETHRAVEQLRGAVDTDRQAVAEDRRAVENTALQFGQFAQSAINAVGQAQEAAVGAVSAEGQRQTTAVQQAGTHAVSDVETAKTTAVQAVTTEGDTQTKRVQDAAAGIVADREQIAANKAGVESLQQNKADAIVETAQGETVTLTDSSDKLFRGLRVFGRSIQDGTPSVENPVPIVNAGENGSITVEVTGRNLLKPSFVPDVQGTYAGWKIKDDDKNVTVSIIDKKPNEPLYNGLYIGVSGNGINANEGAGWVLANGRITNAHIVTKFKYFTIYNPQNVPISELLDRYDIQIEYGITPTPYEPYTHQSLTLATPNGLPGVPVSKDGNYTDQNGQQWVCDEVDLGRGKYVQRVAEKDVLESQKQWPGTGLWGNVDGNSTLAFLSYINGTNGEQNWGCVNNAGMCNYFVRKNGVYNNSEIGFSISDYVAFRVPRSQLPDWDESNPSSNPWINWLRKKKEEGKPLKVQYILTTPIERDLTPEELAAYSSLHTNYPTTVITNDAGAHMEVSYVADTGTYVRNMEERLNAKLVNIQSALISQKISGGGIKVADSARVPVVRFAMWGKTEQVVTTGAQLFDVADVERKVILNMNGTTSANGSVHTSGFVKVLPSTKYSVSKTRQNRGKFYDIDKRVLTTDKFDFELSNSGDKFVTSEQTEYVRFSIYETENLDNVMVNAGDTLKPWEPYSGGFPSPSPDYPQPIEITDQPVTVTIKGGTKQQSITLIPPRPFTKWDKLEKVDGVWCWVYQHKVLSGAEIKENYKGIHSFGAVMISISTLGDTDSQNDAVSNKFIHSTQSVSTLKNGEFRIAYGNAYLKIDGVTTVEDGRQWLESNDIIIIAQTSAPEFIPLSPSEQAQLNALTMYAPETEVTNTGGCNMELTYTVDTKSYVDSKIAAISAAVLEV